MQIELDEDEEEEIYKLHERVVFHVSRVEEIEEEMKRLSSLFQREIGKAEVMREYLDEKIDEFAKKHGVSDTASFDMDRCIFEEEVKEDA